MSIYINKNLLDLKKIRSDAGEYYQGNDEVMILLARTWEMFSRKFFSKNLPVVFVTPGIRSGLGKGNQGYSFARVANYKTKKQGPVTVAWADGIKNEGGRDFFYPISEKVGINDKTMILDESDIEKILFMYLFNPHMINEKRTAGKTFLEDKEADALKYEQTEQSNAIISYWLFRKESPFYADEDKVDILCLAWGINPDGKSLAYKKQLLAEAVKQGEKKNDRDHNMNALNDRCERLKDGQDTREIEVMAVIQKAANGRIIAYDFGKFSWSILDTEGKPIKVICKVPPAQTNENKIVLRRYLMQNQEELQIITSSLSMDPMPSKNDRVLLQEALPDFIDEEYITTRMSWPDRKAIFKFVTQASGDEMLKAKKEDIHIKLIDYFVTQKKTVDYDVKRH